MQRKISAALASFSTLPSSSWTGTSSGTFNRKGKDGGKSFKSRNTTTSTLLTISTRVVSGFNHRNPISRTIAIAMDISGFSQGSIIFRALFNYLVSGLGLPHHRLRHDVLYQRFYVLASAPCIVEAETRANLLCSTLVRWADGKQQAIDPQKSRVTQFTSDTLK